MSEDSVIQALQSRLAHAVVGRIMVRGARAERTRNYADHEVYRVELDVDDPDGPTWSVEDLTALDVLANQIAGEAGAEEYVYVQLTAASENDAVPEPH